MEARQEASDFVRKIISGAFAVRSYDYFRVTPPQRDDHVHLDPIELVCAVTERCKTFTILVTLNKIGLELPPQLRRVWQGKLKAVQQSASQMATCIRSLDPAERENARQYIRALGDAQPRGASFSEHQGSRRHEETAQAMNLPGPISMKRTTERIQSAGLIRVDPTHLGCEDFLAQRTKFEGHMNCEVIKRGDAERRG